MRKITRRKSGESLTVAPKQKKRRGKGEIRGSNVHACDLQEGEVQSEGGLAAITGWNTLRPPERGERVAKKHEQDYPSSWKVRECNCPLRWTGGGCLLSLMVEGKESCSLWKASSQLKIKTRTNFIQENA